MTDDKSNEVEETFDDFDDDFEEGAPEEEFVEEDWDSFDDEGDFGDQQIPEGKKSSKLFTVIIILMVLGGGGFLGLKLMGGKGGGNAGQNAPQQMPVADSPMTEPNDLSTANAMPAPKANSSGNVQDQNGSGALPADLTPPPSSPELDFDMPMPFSNANTEGEEDGMPANPEETADREAGDDMNNAPGQDAALLPVESAPLTPMPSSERGGRDEYADAVENDVSEKQTLSGAGQAEGFSDSSRDEDMSLSGNRGGPDLTAIESKLDLLFDRLDSIEAEIDSVRDSNRSPEIESLKKTVQRLEREIGSMATRPVPSSASKASADNLPSSDTVPLKRRSAPSATESDSWDLTSAQPGKATLRHKKSNDVIAVEVGESVSGLGRITAIHLKDGKWVVEAANGIVSQ